MGRCLRRIRVSSTTTMEPFSISDSIIGKTFSNLLFTNSIREDDNRREIREGTFSPENEMISEKLRSCVIITRSSCLAASTIVLSEELEGMISFATNSIMAESLQKMNGRRRDVRICKDFHGIAMVFSLANQAPYLAA